MLICIRMRTKMCAVWLCCVTFYIASGCAQRRETEGPDLGRGDREADVEDLGPGQELERGMGPEHVVVAEQRQDLHTNVWLVTLQRASHCYSGVSSRFI